MTESPLAGTRAIVVGAGRGIGEGTALALARAGANVGCIDIDADNAGNVAAQIGALGRRSFSLGADACSRDDLVEIVRVAREHLGGIDLCVDVVGVSLWCPLLELTDEAWDQSHELNLRHVFRLFQLIAGEMIKDDVKGSLVAISSVSGLQAAPGHAPYGAFKAALIALTKSFAVELGSRGIRVNTVAPYGILAPSNDAVLDQLTAHRLRMKAELPPIGLGHPDDIANAVVFLASDQAKFITGQTLVVDGGASVRGPADVAPL